MHSECFEELDLDDNLIGDLGGKEILEGLEYRKEGLFRKIFLTCLKSLINQYSFTLGKPVLRYQFRLMVKPGFVFSQFLFF